MAGADIAPLHIQPSENEIKHKLVEARCDEQHANLDEQVIIPVIPRHLELSLLLTPTHYDNDFWESMSHMSLEIER